jgi:hypothetical protein
LLTLTLLALALLTLTLLTLTLLTLTLLPLALLTLTLLTLTLLTLTLLTLTLLALLLGSQTGPGLHGLRSSQEVCGSLRKLRARILLIGTIRGRSGSLLNLVAYRIDTVGKVLFVLLGERRVAPCHNVLRVIDSLGELPLSDRCRRFPEGPFGFCVSARGLTRESSEIGLQPPEILGQSFLLVEDGGNGGTALHRIGGESLNRILDSLLPGRDLVRSGRCVPGTLPELVVLISIQEPAGLLQCRSGLARLIEPPGIPGTRRLPHRLLGLLQSSSCLSELG